MAAYTTAAWPAHLALTARMTNDPTADTLAALKAHGPRTSVQAEAPRLAPDAAATVLESPFDYPISFVAAADRAARSGSDAYLADVAADAKWFSS